MNARFGIGLSLPNRAVSRALLTALLIPVLTAGCDIFGPSSSEEIILEPFETTWLSELAPFDPATHPPEAPGGELLIDSLFYGADVLVADTAVGSGPMSLTLRHSVRNPFDDPVTIRVPGCPGKLRAYATIDRMGPPIWESSRSSLGLADCGAEVDVTVPPQEEIAGGVFLRPFLLSRELPEGRFYFTLEISPVDEEPLLLPMGSADVRFREPGLEFGVTVEDTGETVRPEVQVTNRNDVPMTLGWGTSAVGLALYYDAARSKLAKEVRLGGPDIGFVATLEPGETLPAVETIQGNGLIIREFDHEKMLDLPPGRYFLSVRVEINWRLYGIPAGEIRLR